MDNADVLVGLVEKGFRMVTRRSCSPRASRPPVVLLAVLVVAVGTVGLILPGGLA